jgi:hypothetical protein
MTAFIYFCFETPVIQFPQKRKPLLTEKFCGFPQFLYVSAQFYFKLSH